MTLGGEVKVFQDLRVGATVTIPLGDDRDARLEVDGQLANGARIRGLFPTVRNVSGGGRPRLVVKPDGELGCLSRPKNEGSSRMLR